MGKEHQGLFLFTGIAVVLVGVISWRKYIFQKRRLKRLKQGSVNIGGIFGMDVGGTLTKIVYFEPIITTPAVRPPSSGSTASSSGVGHSPARVPTNASPQSSPSRVKAQSSTQLVNEAKNEAKPVSTLKRSDSLNKLDLPDHQEALHQLYKDFSNVDDKKAGTTREDALSFYSPILGGRLNFLHFETRNMVSTVNVLSANAVTDNIRSIGCTGGGAMKYAKFFQEEQDITITPYDELASLVTGMNFTLTNVEGECYTYREQPLTAETAADAESFTDDNNKQKTPSSSSAESPSMNRQGRKDARWRRDVKDRTEKVIIPFDVFSSSTHRATGSVPSRPATRSSDQEPSTPQYQPYLVVNVGSGVSILKVTSPTEFERVSGTSLGGGTYWGLCRLLTHCSKYEEVLDMAEAGDASEVDMLVRDIYGGDYGLMHLSGSMVASSFGKLVMKDNPREGIKEEDFAIALLMMITNNIGQIAYLNAKLHGCTKIFFVGSFLRHNSISCRRLAFAIDFWSKGEMEALFLKHEGYFGALGTFLMSAFGDDLDKALNLDSQRRVLDRLNQSGEDGSSGNGVSGGSGSVGARDGNRSQGSSSGLASPGATFSLSSTADGSALKFVKRSRRDNVSTSGNSSGSGNSSSSSGGKGMLYGIEREFLDRIRAWEPLSFSSFRFHLSGADTRNSNSERGNMNNVVGVEGRSNSVPDSRNRTLWSQPADNRSVDEESQSSASGSGASRHGPQTMSQNGDLVKSRSHSDMFPSAELQTAINSMGATNGNTLAGLHSTAPFPTLGPSLSQRSMSMSAGDDRPGATPVRLGFSSIGGSSNSNLVSIGMSLDDSSLSVCPSPVHSLRSPRQSFTASAAAQALDHENKCDMEAVGIDFEENGLPSHGDAAGSIIVTVGDSNAVSTADSENRIQSQRTLSDDAIIQQKGLERRLKQQQIQLQTQTQTETQQPLPPQQYTDTKQLS